MRASTRNPPGEFVGEGDCRPFLRELRARGIDYRSRLAPLGIRDLDQDSGSEFLSVQQFTVFLQLVEELAGDLNIGLYAGARLQVADLGLLGLLLRSSPDGESAYGYGAAYGDAIRGALRTEVSRLDGVIVCRRSSGALGSSRTLSQYFAAAAVTCARHLHGAVDPLEVRLAYPAPMDTAEHVRILRGRLRFGERQDAVVFSAELLSRATLHPDPEAAEVLRRHVARLSGAARPGPADLVSRTRQLIASELSRGRTTMPEVARRLQISERTLRRHLEELNTSFQTLLDEVRRDRALQYMRESHYSAPELSARLGFNGPPAFYRAFRRWTGTSWSAYRGEHGGAL